MTDLGRPLAILSSLLFTSIAGVECKSGPTAMDYLGDAREALEEDRYGEASGYLDLSERNGGLEREIQTLRARIERGRAIRALDAGRDREAYETFIRAADIDPRRRASAQTYLRALEVGRRLGISTPQLASVAQKAVEADPGSARARRHAGRLWDAAGEREKAAREYLWIWQSDRSRTDIGRRLAVVYIQLDRPEDAIAILEQVLEQSPDDAQASIKLAKLYARVGDSARARQVYERLVDEHPDKPGVLLQYARFLREQGDRSRANRLQEQAYEQMPGREEREMRELQ